MSDTRPLPARPNLAYERKQAKRLLRQLHAGDPEALARAAARYPGLDPATARLAHAQLVIAREYGFASWPRLVQYYEAAARVDHRVQRAILTIPGGGATLERQVGRLLAHHREGHRDVGRLLAAYVPRFYGLGPEAALAATITEDDARLAVARRHRFLNWEAAVAGAGAAERERLEAPWLGEAAHRRAVEAIRTADLAALERVVAANPALLTPSAEDVATGRTLISWAVGHERLLGIDAIRPIMTWLDAHGFNRQAELNAALCGGRGPMSAADVRALLAQGADPNWVAPNGIPVLEHALLRYFDRAAVDVLAARTTPRRALWIAAGLGDVAGVREFFDAHGRPMPEARQLRPDFDSAGRAALTSLPDPDDEELLLETLLVAVLNDRGAVIAALTAFGAPVNSLLYGTPLLSLAVGHGMTNAVESLLRAGADLDLEAGPGTRTPREHARTRFEQRPEDAKRRHILVLCGMDPATVLAEGGAQLAPAPLRMPIFEEALALAADDAVRRGDTEVRPENLLVGLLRAADFFTELVASAGGVDAARVGAAFAGRLRPAGDRTNAPTPSRHPEAEAVIHAAIAYATELRHIEVHGGHLLAVLLRDERNPAVRRLMDVGTDVRAVVQEVARMLL